LVFSDNCVDTAMNVSLSSARTIFSLEGEDIGYAGTIALQNVTLSIDEGEKIALIGQSGAGKTTLLRRLYRCETDNCAFIHQHYGLVPQLTVFHNIYMGRIDAFSAMHNLRNLISPMSLHVDEIAPIAGRLGLEKQLFKKVGALSGGQQQRVGIGRALYRGSSVLMADEPVSSLDTVQGEDILSFITNTDKTVISSLHSIELARKYFDRLIGLRNRSISFDLPAENVSSDMLNRLYN